MKAQTVKGLLVAGAMLASVAAWGENVESTATRNADLDTRDQAYRIGNVNEVLKFAYNNVTSWTKGGDEHAAAAVVTVTQMLGDPAADPTTWTETSGIDTLDTVPGEHTAWWVPEAQALYRAEMTDAAGAKTRAYFDLSACEGIGVSIRRATVTLSAEDMTYTGEQLVPTMVVTFGDTLLRNDVDYQVVEITDNVNAGLATITIRGMGAYSGVTEKTFRIQPQPATLTADLDTRELAVRKPASVDEILALAWNNTSAWQKGGDTAGTAVVLALTPMAGDSTADPTTWTEDGVAKMLSEATGEGTFNMRRSVSNTLYKVTLAGGATLDETAYFDLSDLELPPDPVERLKEIFGDKATVEMMPDGTVEVTLTDDLEEPLELPDDLGKVRINLNDHDLVGTDGDAESPDGTAAITIAKGEGVDGATELALVGGDVTGGAGYSAEGSGTAGNGGAAILVAEGATATVDVGEGVTVTGGKGGDSDVGMPGLGGLGVDPETAIAEGSAGTVKSGENGAKVPTVNIVKALQRYPWNGKIDVDYAVDGDGSRFDLVLTLAADGQSWTATAANLSGDVELTDGMTEADVKRVTWDAAADCGTDVVDKNATLTLTVVKKDE